MSQDWKELNFKFHLLFARNMVTSKINSQIRKRRNKKGSEVTSQSFYNYPKRRLNLAFSTFENAIFMSRVGGALQ